MADGTPTDVAGWVLEVTGLRARERRASELRHLQPHLVNGADQDAEVVAVTSARTSLTWPSKDLQRSDPPNLRLIMENVVSTLDLRW